MRRVRSSALQSGFRLSRIVGLCALAFAAIPAQGALALPSGMHYEMVSPPDTFSSAVEPAEMRADDNRLGLNPGTEQASGDTPGASRTTNRMVAERTPVGWLTRSMNPPATDSHIGGEFYDITPDLGTALYRTSTWAQYTSGQDQLTLTRFGGPVQPLLPVLADLSGQADPSQTKPVYLGAARDLSRFVVAAGESYRYHPGDYTGVLGSDGRRLYTVIPGNPGLLLRLAVDSAGALIGPACGASLGSPSPLNSKNAISADGLRVFFSAKPGQDASCTVGAPLRIYARTNDTSTVNVSASECQRVAPACSTATGNAVYQGASVDGERVFFTSTEQLTSSDQDSTADLYVYDFASPADQRLTQLSLGPVPPGSGADVQAALAIADDGSRVYFSARGVLTTGANGSGLSPIVGATNIYTHDLDSGQTNFVATISTGELTSPVQRRVGVSDAAASHFIFTTTSKVLPVEDTDSAQDIYRYEASTGSVVKVSPGNTANPATTIFPFYTAKVSGSRRAISADGTRVIFDTIDALDPEDTNGVADSYLWTEGAVELVGDGMDPRGTAGASISPSGHQIAFSTSERLLPEDVDLAVATYVARTGPDVELPPVFVDPTCDGDACQGSAAPRPQGSVLAPAVDDLGNVLSSRLSVSKPGAAALRSAARSGVLAVRVRAAGTVSVSATARIGRSSKGVGKASRRVGGTAPKTVSLKVHLSRAARRQLARKGSLRVALRVRSTGSRGAKRVAVVLRAPSGKAAANGKRG